MKTSDAAQRVVADMHRINAMRKAHRAQLGEALNEAYGDIFVFNDDGSITLMRSPEEESMRVIGMAFDQVGDAMRLAMRRADKLLITVE